MEEEFVSREGSHRPPLVMTRGIVRPRLLDLLDPDDQTRVLLVTAPAGYGKTTLLAQHFGSSRAAGRTVAWLGLDEGMAEAEILADQIRHSIGFALSSGLGESSTAFHKAISGKALLNTVEHAIAKSNGRLTVYLDDLHNADSTGALSLLDGLLTALPENLNLILASRSRPKLKLSRLAASGQLREVTDRHLAFTASEASNFLGELLPEKDIDELVRRTEGWPAGLQLCRFMFSTDASASESHMARAKFDVANLSGRAGHIVDYLAEQVFDRVDQDTQDFLLKTSVLKCISGPFADEVIDGAKGRDTLDWLYNNNLFIFALDSEKEWFRYHQLFREFLLEKLRKKDPKAEEKINRRAALWLVNNGRFSDALGHAFAVKDLSFANEIASKAGGWRRILVEGTLIFRPLEDADEEELMSYPTLQLARVYYLLHHGQLRRARYLYDTCFSDLRTETGNANAEPAPTFYEIDCQVIDLLISLYEDKPWPLKRIEELEEHLKAELSLDPRVNAIANELLAWVYYWAGKFEKSVGTASMAAQKCRAGNAPFIEFYAHLARGMSLSALARLKEAEGAFDAAYEIAAGIMGPDGYQCAAAAACKAEIHLERGEIEEAKAGISAMVPIINSSEVWVDLAYSTYKISAWVKAEQQDLPAALAVIEEARAVFAELSLPRLQTMLKMQKARILSSADEVDETAAIMDAGFLSEVSGDLDSDRPEGWRIAIPCLLVLVRFEIARRNLEKARKYLDALKRWISITGARRYEVECDLATALLAHLSGDRRIPAEAVGRALRNAVTTGQIFPFAMWIDGLRPYLKAFAGDAGSVHSSVAALAAVLLEKDFLTDASEMVLPKPAFEHIPRPCTDHPALSPREREVFRFLCDGLTSKQIAKELRLSPNTVMGYRKSIYQKLDVSSRAGLVRVARGLGASPRN